MTTVFVRMSALAGAIGGGAAALQAVRRRVGTRRTRGAPFHPNG